MSPSFLKKIVRNRTIVTAIVNAIVTWIILIVAPLGLFAVIICTVGVFLSSLLIGNLSDRALLFLVTNGDRQSLNDTNSPSSLNAQYITNNNQDSRPTSDSSAQQIPQQIKKLLK
jgi:fucose permease